MYALKVKLVTVGTDVLRFAPAMLLAKIPTNSVIFKHPLPPAGPTLASR